MELTFNANGTPGITKAYYQWSESGFPLVVPKELIDQGIEIARVIQVETRKNPSRISLGQELEVSIRLRSSHGQPIANVAIVDLMPAGFELVKGEVPPGSGTFGFDYVEVREDRIVYYGTLTGSFREIRYRLKPIARGKFQVPPVSAASMYNRGVSGLSTGSVIEVVK